MKWTWEARPRSQRNAKHRDRQCVISRISTLTPFILLRYEPASYLVRSRLRLLEHRSAAQGGLFAELLSLSCWCATPFRHPCSAREEATVSPRNTVPLEPTMKMSHSSLFSSCTFPGSPKADRLQRWRGMCNTVVSPKDEIGSSWQALARWDKPAPSFPARSTGLARSRRGRDDGERVSLGCSYCRGYTRAGWVVSYARTGSKGWGRRQLGDEPLRSREGFKLLLSSCLFILMCRYDAWSSREHP